MRHLKYIGIGFAATKLVAALISRAYDLGLEDGRRKMAQEMEQDLKQGNLKQPLGQNGLFEYIYTTRP